MFNISNARRYLVPTTLSRSHQFASDASGGNEIKSWERDRNSLPRDSSRFLELASRGNAKKNFGKRNLKINSMSLFYSRRYLFVHTTFLLLFNWPHSPILVKNFDFYRCYCFRCTNRGFVILYKGIFFIRTFGFVDKSVIPMISLFCA